MVGLRSTTRAFLLATALTFAVGLAARASSVDVGYGPDLFYYLRHDGTGFSTYGTISTSGAVTDRFGVGNNFDALTFASNNLGYGSNPFYYFRHDSSGHSIFGTISTSGAVTDRFGVGNNFDALAFAPENLGYGLDLFYYLRHDSSGFSTFGTISTSGAVTDRFGVGNNFDALTFAEDFNAPAVPEPGTLILFLTGLPILVGFRRARCGTGS